MRYDNINTHKLTPAFRSPFLVWLPCFFCIFSRAKETSYTEKQLKKEKDPFTPKLIMQILPTIQEENDWVM